MAKRTCRGRTRAGKRCRANPPRGKAYCRAHDPALPSAAQFGSPDQADADRAKGGRATRKARPSEVARELVEANVAAILRPYFKSLGLLLADDGTTTEVETAIKWQWAGADEPAVEVEDLGAQILAAEKLLDRIYGRARQQVEHQGDPDRPIGVDHTGTVVQLDLSTEEGRAAYHELLDDEAPSEG